MANCPQCGAQASGKFCPSCGSPMPQEYVTGAAVPTPQPQTPPPFPPQAQQPGYPPQQPAYPPQQPGYQQPGYQPGYQQPGFAPVPQKRTSPLLWWGVGIGLGLIIAIVVVLFAGGGGYPAGSVVITDSVNAESQAPDRELTTVPPTTNPVYAAYRVETDREASLLAKWYINGEHIPSLDTPYDVGAGEGWVTFQITSQSTLPTGTFKIEIYKDGQLAHEKSFQVQ